MIPDRVQYLVRSEERVRILEALADGPARQCTLRRECSLARSTVHRNLEGCRERGWVVETGDGYALTAAGERMLAAYRRFADAARTVADHEPVLERLDGVGEPPPAAALDGCQTTATGADDPHAPSVAAAEVVRRNAGTSMRVAASGVSPITNAAARDALAAGSDIEVVVDESVHETLRRSYGAAVEAARSHDRFELLLSPSAVDTGIVLAGEAVCVVVHDDGGNARATLTGANAALRDWATAAYRRVREGAAPVDDRATPAGSDR